METGRVSPKRLALAQSCQTVPAVVDALAEAEAGPAESLGVSVCARTRGKTTRHKNLVRSSKRNSADARICTALRTHEALSRDA